MKAMYFGIGNVIKTSYRGVEDIFLGFRHFDLNDLETRPHSILRGQKGHFLSLRSCKGHMTTQL